MPLTLSCSPFSSNSNAEKFGRNESNFVCSLFAITQPYKQMAISFVFLRSHNSLHSLTFLFSAVELDVLSFNKTPQMPFIFLQGESLARGPKLLSMYKVQERGFLFRKYWQTASFKACQTAFRTEFGERRAPSKCSVQKLVKKLETRVSRSNACRLLSLGPIDGQGVQKYTLHNRTTQRRYTPAVNVDTLEKVFQNLEKRIRVCLDVKGDQFQHRL